MDFFNFLCNPINMTNYEHDFPTLADPLGETLYQLRLDGSLYALSELKAPWGIDMPALPGKMMFHIVTSGSCWLKTQGNSPIELQQGSLVLLPKGQGHYLLDSPGAATEPFFDLPVQQVNERFETLHYGGNGKLTKLTCCVVHFDHTAGERLISQLPEVLHINSLDTDVDGWLEQSLRFLAREAREPRPGGQTIMANLADILVIQAIRTWINTSADADSGWLAALRDRHIGNALVAIHRAPEKNWSVELLAKNVGLSRSGFSARFTSLVGEPVMQYVTRWRMLLAKGKLLEGKVTLGELSEQLGYQSEAAFARAFKRTVGISPGSVRHLDRAS